MRVKKCFGAVKERECVIGGEDWCIESASKVLETTDTTKPECSSSS